MRLSLFTALLNLIVAGVFSYLAFGLIPGYGTLLLILGTIIEVGTLLIFITTTNKDLSCALSTIGSILTTIIIVYSFLLKSALPIFSLAVFFGVITPILFAKKKEIHFEA